MGLHLTGSSLTTLNNAFARLSGVQATVSADGALVPGQHNPVDASGGNRTVTLADAVSAGQLVVVSKKDSSANTVTVSVAHLRDGGAGTITLVGQYEALTLTSKADGSWWPIGDHKTKAYFEGAFAKVVTLTSGTGNSAANTALIQAALNAGGTVRIRCGDSDTAYINATLTVPSRTTVYVECILQLTVGAAALPLWQNAAHLVTPAAVTSFTQAAWSAGSTPPGILGTITVASHSLSVGDWVAVEGATNSGYNGVFQVLATTSTTLTVTMPFTAAATTATGTLTFTKADTDIAIIGGTAYQNGAAQTSNADDHLNVASIWHRFNNLTIDRMRVRDSKRYAWHLGCGNAAVLRNLRVENANASGASDGIHLGGALFNTIIDGVAGTTGDDFISMTIGDYSTIQMTKGDFYNTQIRNLRPESVLGEIVKMTGGSSQFYFKDTVIDGMGGVGAVYGVQVYDDTSSGGTLLGTAGDRLVVKNVSASVQSVVYCNITGVLEAIEVDGVDGNMLKNAKELVLIVGSSTVRKISVRNVTKTTTAYNLTRVVSVGGTSTVGRIDVSRCYITSGGISGQYFYAVLHGGGTINTVSISDCTFASGGASGGAAFASVSGVTDGIYVTMRDVSVNQLDSLADFLAAGTLHIGAGVVATNLWGSSRLTSKTSGKKITLVGGPIYPIKNKADLVVSGGGTSDVMGDFFLDGAQVTTPQAGSKFYNTNTAWSSGSGTDKSGQYGYTGSAWTKLFGPA